MPLLVDALAIVGAIVLGTLLLGALIAIVVGAAKTAAKIHSEPEAPIIGMDVPEMRLNSPQTFPSELREEVSRLKALTRGDLPPGSMPWVDRAAMANELNTTPDKLDQMHPFWRERALVMMAARYEIQAEMAQVQQAQEQGLQVPDTRLRFRPDGHGGIGGVK